jgi:PhoD related phosphatase
VNGTYAAAGTSASGSVDVICGPLLNYRRMDVHATSATWYGSVLIVTNPGQTQPQLFLRHVGPVSQDSNGVQSDSQAQALTFEGTKLYEDPKKAFWRFSISLPLYDYEAQWAYTIPDFQYTSDPALTNEWRFAVPAWSQSMRIMFHSCNGFSVGTDTDSWAGPALWNDVLRVHAERPFHVMIGGGDQIYNDGIRVEGPLNEWTNIANPIKRQAHDFNGDLRTRCDEYYYNNYVRWYNHEPFKTANGQIPQINIWDDHDIIDGFGSYTDHFMKCAVFRGIGGVAFKYYCLFQHHVAPPKSTFTTDSEGPVDPRQLENTFVLEEQNVDPMWILGKSPGPYVEEKSRSLYMRLGKRIAFVGVDARTERTRMQVNYPETYDLIFDRLQNEISQANGEIKHLILLLGVPIAYPRLAWLENLITSPLIAPVRLLNKRFGVAGGLFNKFDGQVDLLDDLDDHYTARHHKVERRELIHRLQQFSKANSVRVTILGGDVHLSALGRFYSNLKLNIPAEKDFRYMPNIVSSAITNKPPPKTVANLLARRNKIHHLDHDTDETLMPLFDKQPGGVEKSASWNNVTMPSRNYACITEIEAPVTNGFGAHEHSLAPSQTPKDGHSPLHAGEEGVGTTHKSADGVSNSNQLAGGLDVAIRVEIEQGNRDGNAEGYGLTSKSLDVWQCMRMKLIESSSATGCLIGYLALRQLQA